MDKKIQVYHNPRCSKSRTALDFLAENGIKDIQIFEYMKNPLSEKELNNILGKLKMSASELVRKKEKNYTELGLESASENELVKKMIEYPNLMERPIVINGDRAVVARPTEKILEII